MATKQSYIQSRYGHHLGDNAIGGGGVEATASLTPIERAAELAGFKSGVLKLLSDGLDIQVREIEEDGAKVEKPFVVSKDGDEEKLTPLVDYFKAQGDDAIEALSISEQVPSFATSNTQRRYEHVLKGKDCHQ